MSRIDARRPLPEDGPAPARVPGQTNRKDNWLRQMEMAQLAEVGTHGPSKPAAAPTPWSGNRLSDTPPAPPRDEERKQAVAANPAWTTVFAHVQSDGIDATTTVEAADPGPLHPSQPAHPYDGDVLQSPAGTPGVIAPARQVAARASTGFAGAEAVPDGLPSPGSAVVARVGTDAVAAQPARPAAGARTPSDAARPTLDAHTTPARMPIEVVAAPAGIPAPPEAMPVETFMPPPSMSPAGVLDAPTMQTPPPVVQSGMPFDAPIERVATADEGMPTVTGASGVGGTSAQRDAAGLAALLPAPPAAQAGMRHQPEADVSIAAALVAAMLPMSPATAAQLQGTSIAAVAPQAPAAPPRTVPVLTGPQSMPASPEEDTLPASVAAPERPEESDRAPPPKWKPRLLHVTGQGDEVELWIRDTKLSQSQSAALIARIAADIGQFGLRLRGASLNGKPVAYVARSDRGKPASPARRSTTAPTLPEVKDVPR